MLTVLFANAFAGPLQQQQQYQSQQFAQDSQVFENFRGPQNFRGRQAGEMPLMDGVMPPMPPGQMAPPDNRRPGMSPSMKDIPRDPKVELNMQSRAPFFMMKQPPMMPSPQMFNGLRNQPTGMSNRMEGGQQFGTYMPPQMFNPMLAHQFAMNMPPQMHMLGPMMFRGQPMGSGMGMVGPHFGGPQGMFGPGPQQPQFGPQFWQKPRFDGKDSMPAHWRRDSDQPLDRQDRFGSSDVSSMAPRWHRDSDRTLNRQDRFGNEGSHGVSSLDDQKLYVSLLKEKYEHEAAQLRQMENDTPRSHKRNF